MIPRNPQRGIRWVGWLVGWLFAATASAQLGVGNLYGKVVDADGDTMAGVEVTLRGAGTAHTVESDDAGRFRFLALFPGNYALEAAHDGYTTALYDPVLIRFGRATTVEVQLARALGETITVTSEPPPAGAVDGTARRELAGEELGVIPAAADPWSAALSQTPGVLVEGGPLPGVAHRAPTVVSPGARGGDADYAVDGTVVAEGTALPAAVRTTAVTAFRVTQGGPDAALAGRGVLLDLVTERGTDELRAAVDLGRVDRRWQGAPRVEGVAVGDDATTPGASRVAGLTEVGGDLAGRLVPGHLWGWASYGIQQVERQAVGGGTIDSDSRRTAAKLNAQVSRSNSAVLSYHASTRHDRGRGAAPDRSAETTLVDFEPSRIFQGEDSQLLGGRLQLTGRYAAFSGGSFLTPAGGAATDASLAEDGVWRGTFGDFRRQLDSRLWQLEGEAFRGGPVKHHEIRFGIGRRSLASSSAERWGRDSLVHLAGENFGTPFDIVRVVRPSDVTVDRDHFFLWLQDSFFLDRWTIDLGFRHDVERGASAAFHGEANPVFPELLPALEAGRGGPAVQWASVAPRLGASYVFGRERRTVVRASLGTFTSRLYDDLVTRVAPARRAELLLGFEDADANRRFDLSDPHFVLNLQGVDPQAADVAASPHANDPFLDPERTVELRLGVEHRLRRQMVLTLDYSRRAVSDILEVRRLVRDESGLLRPATSADYRLDQVWSGLLPDGQPFAAPIYTLRPGLEYTGGNLVVNGDRRQEYEDLSLGFTRRMTGSWMLRGSLTLSDWRWRVGPGFRRFDDPTLAGGGASADAAIPVADGQGEVVAPTTSFPGEEELFLNSRWSFHLLGLYQVAVRRPWGFRLAGALHGREGYPIPYAVAVVASDGELRSVRAAPHVDSFRLDDVYSFDLRLEKEVPLGPLRAVVSLDGFNLLDGGYVLERERQLNSPQADRVRETVSPRTFRLGLRLSLR